MRIHTIKKIKILSTTLILMWCLSVFANKYEDLIEIVKRDYTKQQNSYNEIAKAKRYYWEIVKFSEYPFWCEDQLDSLFGDTLSINGFEILKLNDSRSSTLIGVKSYIKKNGSTETEVYRMFFYQLNSKNKWYQYKKPVKTTLIWDKAGFYKCQ